SNQSQRILANVPFIESIPIFADNKLLNNNSVFNN
ncbi:unnamed protein product, partial [Rotaria sordida]